MPLSSTIDMELRAFIAFTIISFVLCEECILNSRTPEMETEKRLKHHLTQCFSDISTPPVNQDSNTLIVKLEYLMQSFQFDYNEEIVTLYSWNYFDWQDDRLTWNPQDYEDMKSTQIRSFDIWSPGLKLVNTADEDDFDFFYTKCKLNSTGHVQCVLRTEHKVFCTSNLSNWPYDTKTCKLEFDQWRPQETRVIFTLSHIKYVTLSYQGAGWIITREKVFKNLTTGIQSTVKFQFERLAEGLEATIVVPAFVIAALTVASLFLDYRDTNRLGILCLSVISHFVFSYEISENLPKHSANTPVILLFISGSTVVTLMVLMFTFCFKYLGTKKKQAPMWIGTCNDFVLDNYGRYLVVTKWEINDKDSREKPDVEWVNFVSITNSICIIVVTITYIYLLANYIPKQPVHSFVFDIA